MIILEVMFGAEYLQIYQDKLYMFQQEMREDFMQVLTDLVKINIQILF